MGLLDPFLGGESVLARSPFLGALGTLCFYLFYEKLFVGSRVEIYENSSLRLVWPDGIHRQRTWILPSRVFEVVGFVWVPVLRATKFKEEVLCFFFYRDLYGVLNIYYGNTVCIIVTPRWLPCGGNTAGGGGALLYRT